jgi:hypothetical protein
MSIEIDTDLTAISDAEITDAFGAVGLGDFAKEQKFDYLSIAAKGTDKAVEGSPTYVEGLKPGYFFNATTDRVYGNKLRMIILDYFDEFREYKVEMKNGKEGKGDWVKTYSHNEARMLTPAQVASYLKDKAPSGNIFDQVKMFYVILPDFKEDGILKFSQGKGGFKHVRNWATKILKTGEAYPAHIWEVGTGFMTKDDYSWFSIGNNDTTFVTDLGRWGKDIKDDVVEAFRLVQSFRKEDPRTETKQIAAPADDKEIPF